MQRPSYFWFCTLLIFLIGFILRIINLDGASLWYDETVTRVMVGPNSLHDTFDLLLHDPTHLPLYFAIVQLTRPDNDFMLRLPNVFIGLLSIAFLMRLAISLYRNYNLALICGIVLAVNPYTIWLVRTARPNALLLLVVLMAVYFFFQIARGKCTISHWILFILTSMAAYTTHYYAATLPLAQYILFLFTLRGNRKFFWQWVGAQLIAVLPLFMWWYGLTQQETISLGIGWIPQPKPQDLALTFWNLTVGYEGAAHFYEIIGVSAALAGVLVGIYYAIRDWKNKPVDFFWFWMFIPPLLLTFTLSFFRPLYVDRYFMFALPALLFLMIRGWLQFAATTTQNYKIGVALLLIFVMICVINFGVDFINQNHEHHDWRGVVTHIEQNRRPNDALMLGLDLSLIPFYAYFDGDEIPLVMFNQTDISDMPDEKPDFLWLVYQNEQPDIHRQGKFPGFGYEDLPEGMKQWLVGKNIVVQKQFTGVILIGIQVKE